MSAEAGKHQLFQEALERYEKPLLHYVRKLIGDIDRSRDVVQYAFLQLWKQDPHKIENQISSWLYTVCRNRALDRLRGEKRVQLQALENEGYADCNRPHPGPLPSTILEQKEIEEIVNQLIETLPPKKRRIIQLKFQAGMTYKEISEATGYTNTNVGFIIHTAIKEIREKLAKTGLSPGRKS